MKYDIIMICCVTANLHLVGTSGGKLENLHVDNSNKANWPLLGPIRRILSCVFASGDIHLFIFWPLSDVSYFDENRKRKAFQYVKRYCCFL